MSALYPDLTATVFPSDGIDVFPIYLDIVSTDGPLIYEYQQAMAKGDSALASQILAQIPAVHQKIIKATDLNKLTQAIQAVERFYKTDIEPYIESKQNSWLELIKQFTYKGTWEAGTTYSVNNIVDYTALGQTMMFIATSAPPVGTPPTSTAYWRQLTIQGVQGPSGEGLSYKQQWNSGTTYTVNDAVTYDGIVWMALQSSKNIQPGTNDAYWKLVIILETTVYPIQPNLPVAQEPGGLWFNTNDNPTDYYYLEGLGNPADASMILEGYEAYNDKGQKIVGTRKAT